MTKELYGLLHILDKHGIETIVDGPLSLAEKDQTKADRLYGTIKERAEKLEKERKLPHAINQYIKAARSKPSEGYELLRKAAELAVENENYELTCTILVEATFYTESWNYKRDCLNRALKHAETLTEDLKTPGLQLIQNLLDIIPDEETMNTLRLQKPEERDLDTIKAARLNRLGLETHYKKEIS